MQLLLQEHMFLFIYFYYLLFELKFNKSKKKNLPQKYLFAHFLSYFISGN